MFLKIKLKLVEAMCKRRNSTKLCLAMEVKWVLIQRKERRLRLRQRFWTSSRHLSPLPRKVKLEDRVKEDLIDTLQWRERKR